MEDVVVGVVAVIDVALVVVVVVFVIVVAARAAIAVVFSASAFIAVAVAVVVVVVVVWSRMPKQVFLCKREMVCFDVIYVSAKDLNSFYTKILYLLKLILRLGHLLDSNKKNS